MPQRLLREAGAYARLRAYQAPRTKDYERLSFELNEALARARVHRGGAERGGRIVQETFNGAWGGGQCKGLRHSRVLATAREGEECGN